MDINTILSRVKTALRIMTDDFDTEITDLINACLKDLQIAGVEIPSSIDTIVNQAIITYCKIHFGDANGVEMIDRLKKSYDEQKAQLSMATGYTDWGITE